MITLSEEQLDFLKEMFSIGGGNAAGVLSQMFECSAEVQIPEVLFLRSSQASSVLNSGQRAVLLRMNLYGDINGTLLFVIKETQSAYMINLISKTVMSRGAEIKIESQAEWNESVMEEFSNILASSYLGAIGRFCRMSIHHSVPRMEIDTTANAIERSIAEKDTDNGLIVIKNRFSIMETPVEAFFILVLNYGFVAGLATAIDDARREMTR